MISEKWQRQKTVESLMGLAGTTNETHQRVNSSILLQNRLLSSSNDANRQLRIQEDQFAKFCAEAMRQYEQNRIEMFRLAEKEEERRKEEQKAAILAWLKTPGECQSGYHDMFVEVRNKFPDTAVWILNENKIFNWMNEEIPTHSVMWLNGKKGAGKFSVSKKSHSSDKRQAKPSSHLPSSNNAWKFPTSRPATSIVASTTPA